MVNFKDKKKIGVAVILLAVILAVGLFGFSCVGGLVPIGWSGGTVSGDTLYVGSMEGRLMSISLADESRLGAEPLKTVQPAGLLGCSAATSCGTGTTRVPIYGTPVVFGDLVYIAGYNGKIYAYNTSNLATRWVYPREGNLEPFVGGLVFAQNKLFIGCSDGYVYSFDALTGDKLAEFKTGDKIWSTPAVEGDTLYLGSFDKKLYALGTDNLTKKWEYSAEGSVISTPLVHNNVVYFGSFDRNLYAVNAADGSLKWQFTGKNWFWTQPVIINGALYAGCLDGFIYALDSNSGALIKEFDLKSPVSSRPVVVDNAVICASRDGVIYKIDSVSREIAQLTALDVPVDGPLMAYQGIVYINTQDLLLHRINPATGAILTPIPLSS